MAIPDFVLKLRERIGPELLWLPGVSAVVFDDEERVLLTKRADDGRWALVSGILEPGEQPALGIQREILEETGIEAVIESLVSVDSLPPVVYSNGDRGQYLDLCFRARAIGGTARVNDDESLDVRWFAEGNRPSSVTKRDARLIAQASMHDPIPLFVSRRAESVGTTPADDSPIW